MAAILLIVSVSPVHAEESEIDYLAIGDSLAAGINEQGQLGKGYADFLAEMLNWEGALQSFNKGFSVPGYKTSDLLKDLKENPEKLIYNLNGLQEQSTHLKEEIEKAEIITISIGANDVLASLKKDSETNELNYNLTNIITGVQSVGNNYKAIISTIKSSNPNAKIFVMGYYNPFPSLENYETQLVLLVNMIDDTIRSVAVANDAYFVEVSNEIAANAEAYLPNPNNIHLSEAGYQAVAQAFYEAYSISQNQFKDVPASSPYYEEIHQMQKQGIINGYEDGTFRPTEKISRQHAAILLNKVVTFTPKVGVKPYKDVPASHKYYEDIMKIQRTGLLKADKKGNFNPTKNLTRGEMALLLSQGFQLKATGQHPFTDVSQTSEIGKAVAALYEAGITIGNGDGTFRPEEPLSRAHYAVFLNKALQFQNEKN